MGKFILAINPGSTSTKISLFEDLNQVFTHTLRHSNEELAPFETVAEQYEFRRDVIKAALTENNIDIKSLDIVIGRGGLVMPIPSGAYEVNDLMAEHLRAGIKGEHASNLGGLIAKELAKDAGGVKAIIADPVVVDEFEPVARISGNALIERSSVFHALNQKAIAKLHAAKEGKSYDKMNIIVAHLGGGVSVGIHKAGKVVDVNDAIGGEGCFSPERSGGMPLMPIVDLCFSGKYSLKEVKKMISGEGGLNSYVGINAFNEVLKLANEGNEKALAITQAFEYQLAKEIGAMSTVVSGKVDAILVTGGIAYNTELINNVRDRVSFIAPLYIYPGEDEMGALAAYGLGVLNSTEELKVYSAC